MKKLYLKISLAVAAIFGLTAVQPLTASHFLTADLIYSQVAPATYNVQLNVTQDCSGSAGMPANTSIMVYSYNCSSSRQTTLNLQPQPKLLNQECSATGVPACPVNLITYSGTVILNAAELSCSEITFSWSECCRLDLANIQNAPVFDLYTEATVKLSQNFSNSSPGFNAFDIPVFSVKQGAEMIYAIAANDPDCDSLSYELVEPLSNGNTALPYVVNSQTGTAAAFIQNPCPKPPYSNPFNSQYAALTGTFPIYLSPSYPMPSFIVNWNGPPTITYPSAPGGKIWEVQIGFEFNPVNGTLRFRPSLYNNRPGANRYVVDVRINEWRKIGTTVTKVGTSRRSLLITVTNGGNFNPPAIEKFTANGHPIASGEIITIRPGMPLNLQFEASSCSGNLPLTLTSNAAAVLPGAVFASTPGFGPGGSITWTGNSSCKAVKFIQIKVENDDCPLKEFQIHTIGVRVSATAAVTGVTEAQTVRNSDFSAFPNPFTQEVKFKLSSQFSGKQQLLIYNSLGQLIDQLEVKDMGTGQELSWEKAGSQKSGVYLARLMQNGKPVQTIRFTKVN